MTRLGLVPVFALALWAGYSVAEEPAKQADAISRQLVQAKEAFRKACESADRDLFLAIDAKLQEATSDGDLERAKKLKAIREACEKEYLLPTQDGIYNATIEYGRQFQEAKTAVGDAFDELIAEVTKSGDLPRADAVQAEKKRWLELMKSRKTPKTRYRSPIPKDAVRWEGNGHYYKVINIRRQMPDIPWPKAKEKCEEMEGYLACGETPAEMQFLKSLSGHAWTGAYKDKTGKWTWISGLALADAPKADGEGLAFASTDPAGLLARPENGRRRVPDGLLAKPDHGVREGRTWEFICEWDE